MIEEKEYTQSELNNAISKAITEMSIVLAQKQKQIEELNAIISRLETDNEELQDEKEMLYRFVYGCKNEEN